ncbi:uncharacterized protein ACHE_20560S [Aspergillus chevalieri]|uniref:Uncharacterized protein n=1 Tax=Aspergillus chevalieri TaxID=182096 RepID=A0A7R7VIP2_ASPCH|nr:uncharacterized protein ACHE_20560S [Aspergillus chevalieri]BCR85102.1 hypothetical protein ACHE_20560S [Aspergillus chevalieri]
MAATAGPVGQPDIAYTPRYENYKTRTTRRIHTEKLVQYLPEGFPAKLDSDLVWDGNNLEESYDWNYHLTPADLAEVDEALKHFNVGKALSEISQETFPLPNFHATLREISREIHNGHGLASRLFAEYLWTSIRERRISLSMLVSHLTLHPFGAGRTKPGKASQPMSLLPTSKTWAFDNFSKDGNVFFSRPLPYH